MQGPASATNSYMASHPPLVVYQSRRNAQNSLDSTTRMVVEVQLSVTQQEKLEAMFAEKWQKEVSGTLPKENMQRRRDAILTDVLSTAIFVDVLQHDNSVPTFFQRYDEESEDCDGQMVVIPAPSLELKASTTVRGLLQISILPRTLPISSTHAGRPFKLIIRVNNEEFLDTTCFHVLAKEPSHTSVQGPRPRGNSMKKRRKQARWENADRLSRRESDLVRAAEALITADDDTWITDINRLIVARTINGPKGQTALSAAMGGVLGQAMATSAQSSQAATLGYGADPGGVLGYGAGLGGLLSDQDAAAAASMLPPGMLMAMGAHRPLGQVLGAPDLSSEAMQGLAFPGGSAGYAAPGTSRVVSARVGPRGLRGSGGRGAFPTESLDSGAGAGFEPLASSLSTGPPPSLAQAIASALRTGDEEPWSSSMSGGGMGEPGVGGGSLETLPLPGAHESVGPSAGTQDTASSGGDGVHGGHGEGFALGGSLASTSSASRAGQHHQLFPTKAAAAAAAGQKRSRSEEEEGMGAAAGAGQQQLASSSSSAIDAPASAPGASKALLNGFVLQQQQQHAAEMAPVRMGAYVLVDGMGMLPIIGSGPAGAMGHLALGSNSAASPQSSAHDSVQA